MNNCKIDYYTVTIILSTYNGHKYLVEQLESLCKQEKACIKLFVRDDGSNDDTINILNSFKSKFDLLDIVHEDNIGATSSFYRAAQLVNNRKDFESDYYAFCDQDDIWLSNKICVGIDELSKFNNNKPNLYFSNLMMMDNDNNLLGMLVNDKCVSRSRLNALSSICTYGCTCIFNRVALEKFCHISEERKFIYHDNWMYSVCAFLGNTYYDNNSYIHYRQTGSNVSGTKLSGMALWKHRIKKIFNLNIDNHLYESIAAELIDNFRDELNPEDVKFLVRLTNYRFHFKDKIYLLFTRRLKTRSVSKNICIFGRVLLNAL